MKTEVAFLSGAILGAAGVYLICRKSESCDDLKGGAAIKDKELNKIYNPKQTVSENKSFCSKYSKKYSCKNGVLFNKDETTLIRYPSSKSSSTYTIPDSVTSIGQKAFYYCTSLKIINIPKSVTSIGEQAFYSFSSLTSITISIGVTSIGSYAFGECTSLTNISVEKDNNFYSSIDGVLFNKDQTELIIYPSAKIGKNYEIPNSVTSIKEFAFCRCSSLTDITIPTGMTRIGEGAFLNCKLTTITIPNNSQLTSIGSIAFDGCSSLETITIPAGVTSIGSASFRDCTSLEKITIPTGVTSIGSSAFSGCSSLETITIPSNLITKIKVSNVFSDCDKLTNIQDEQGRKYKIVYDGKSKKKRKFVLQ